MGYGMTDFTYSDKVNSICNEINEALSNYALFLTSMYKPWGVVFILEGGEGNEMRFTFTEQHIRANSEYVRHHLDRKIIKTLIG